MEQSPVTASMCGVFAALRLNLCFSSGSLHRIEVGFPEYPLLLQILHPEINEERTARPAATPCVRDLSVQDPRYCQTGTKYTAACPNFLDNDKSPASHQPWQAEGELPLARGNRRSFKHITASLLANLEMEGRAAEAGCPLVQSAGDFAPAAPGLGCPQRTQPSASETQSDASMIRICCHSCLVHSQLSLLLPVRCISCLEPALPSRSPVLRCGSPLFAPTAVAAAVRSGIK
jgi:hypothetical protein